MGSYYNITLQDENEVYERSDLNYIEIKIKNRESQVTDPSSVSITISNPCGTELVDSVAMTNTSTGIYHYDYQIPVDAAYGVYEILIEASSVTYTSTFRDSFVILPWNGIHEVRQLSGITSKKSVSDHDIGFIIWEAYKEALSNVFVYHYRESPKANPDTGAKYNGNNTTFALRFCPIADHDGDGITAGFGEQSCGTDLTVIWKDEDGDCHEGLLTVSDANCSQVEITQIDGSALPGTTKWAAVTYWTEWETYEEVLFRKAVAYLAAHECVLRFHELRKATLADVDSNKTTILASPKRHKEKYKELMRQISKPKIGSAMKTKWWK